MSWKTSTEAAQILGISQSGVRRRALRNTIPRKVLADGTYLYWVDDHSSFVDDEDATIHQTEQETRLEKALYIPDPHIPDNNADVTQILFNFARWFQPDVCFIMGDVLDCYTLSKYAKNPLHEFTVQDELDLAAAFFQDIVNAVGKKCQLYWLLGNHEARFKKYIWTKAPELASLRVLNFKTLMGIDEDVIIVPYNKGVNYRGRHVEHGKVVAAKSGYTAHRLIEKKMISGCNGHTHRMSHVFKRCEGGEFDWVELGTLQKKSVEYTDGEEPNWQYGFGVSYWHPNFKLPKMELVHIDDQMNCCYSGKIFKP